MMADQSVIPVIMFHSLGLGERDWVYNHLSMPASDFEERVAYLKQKGYQFIFWSDLYEHMKGGIKLTGPAVMLTFDDGYLDNWVYAYPILKKYNAKGTIFC